MRISDWSSDVCSSDLAWWAGSRTAMLRARSAHRDPAGWACGSSTAGGRRKLACRPGLRVASRLPALAHGYFAWNRSEEHTPELQSLMRISYAVFCLKKKKNTTEQHVTHTKPTNR